MLQGFTVGVTASQSRQEQAARFEGLGATVVAAPLAEMTTPETWRPAVRLAEAVSSGRVHAVTFASPEAVTGWMAIAAAEQIRDPLCRALSGGDVVVGCLDDGCAAAATASGIDPARLVVADPASPASLVRAVAGALVTHVVRSGPAGPGAAGGTAPGRDAVVVTGTVATIGGRSYRLSPAEARLLAALARRPNTVLSDEELLQSVWQGTAPDPHLVELVVSRLRRRLGPHGSAIASVARRGYALRL